MTKKKSQRVETERWVSCWEPFEFSRQTFQQQQQHRRRRTCYMMLFTLSDVKSPRGSGISGVSGCLGRSGHTRPARSRPLSLWAWSGQKFPRAVAAHCTAVCTTTTSPSPENQLTSSFNKNFRQLSKFHKNIFFHVFFFNKKSDSEKMLWNLPTSRGDQ